MTPRIVTSDRELDIHSPVIGTTASGKVYLCYVKGTEDDTDIHCNRSDDDGITFGSSTDVTKNPGSASLNPKLSVSGDSIHLVWADLTKEMMVILMYFLWSPLVTMVLLVDLLI